MALFFCLSPWNNYSEAQNCYGYYLLVKNGITFLHLKEGPLSCYRKKNCKEVVSPDPNSLIILILIFNYTNSK